MKFLSLITTLLTTAVLSPTLALAHSGHLIDGKVHGFLHTEHLILFTLIGLIVYVIDIIIR